ncbi:MAG TPA: MarR family transcriptional regulator, partial [Polyangiaceae bacterium]
ALRACMHLVPFTFKRAHYACLKMMGPVAARQGLTPARFDLLYYVEKIGPLAHQAGIARRLGVSRATVCRMVRSMKDAGLVTCEAHVRDARRLCVRPTRRGRRAFGRIAKRLWLLRTVDRRLRRALDVDRNDVPQRGLNRALLALDRIAGNAGWIPRGLGDGATYFYPLPTEHFDRR